MDKYTIKQLVSETFIELGYVDVLDKEYIKWCVDNAFEKVVKSYSHKPHLASLPHDLRTTNVDKLNERKEVIEDKIDTTNEKIKKLEKSESWYSNHLKDDVDWINNHISEYDNHLLGFFTDYFGAPDTDKPEKIINDVRMGLGDTQRADDMVKFKDDINKLKDDFDVFHEKMDKVLADKGKPDDVIKLMDSFERSHYKFLKQYMEYSDKYGKSGGYNDESSASREFNLMSGLLKRRQSGRYEVLEGYTNTHNRLSKIRGELEVEVRFLKDYVGELDRVNAKLHS